jgi:hypothetical protein
MAPPLRPRRFWQCQPAGYTAPPEAKLTVTITVIQTLPGIAAANVSTSALESGMQAEINKKLAGGPPACMCTRAALGHAMPLPTGI